MKRKRQRMGAGSVALHIERLVLDGFSLSATEASRLQVSVERELERMLSNTPAGSWNGGASPRIAASPVHFVPGNSPAILGRQIARTLFSSFAPPAPTAPSPRVQTRS